MEDRVAHRKVMSLLMDNGYYRVRLPHLTPFDKLLGGLAWCIVAASSAQVVNHGESDISGSAEGMLFIGC